MRDYTPPDSTVADLVYAREKELEDARREVQGLEPWELRRRLYSQSESTAVRLESLLKLLRQLPRNESRAAKLMELLEPLLSDSNPAILCQAIKLCPRCSSELAAKLRTLTHSANASVRSEAFLALAQRGDPETLESCIERFVCSDQSERNLAIEALCVANTPESRRRLLDGFEHGYRGEQDRVTLGLALLRLGDERGLPLLKEVAQRANDAWSVAAATWIHVYRPVEGLRLMRHILDSGTAAAVQMMVLQISSLADVAHAYTADGIHEARLWIDRQLEDSSAA